MKEQIYEITLKQNLNIQSSSEIEKNTNLIEKEDLETYDKYSYSADYNYKKKKFIPRSFSFNKNLLLIFICFLLGWGAITPNISIVYERLSKGKASTSISEFNYVPIDETDPLFSKDYITAGSAIEIYWTVAETGIIAKLTPIKTANGFICPAEDGGLKVEDEILKINNYPLIEKEKWSTITSADPINVTVKRAGEVLDISITPALAVETNSFKIGIEYLINKAYSQTASTLTFIDYDTGKFASTAHVVEFSKEDEETLKIPNISKLSEGIVFNAKVIGKKSDGLETESISRIGKITSNNDFGVYGIIDNTYLNNLPRFKVAPVSQIVNGEAYILSSVEGEIKKYPITITGVDLKNMSSIQFTVNDDYLKSIGNLLHGMSGSPIIQNDKIIGAVARMNTKTMECYGTLAEIMMKNLEQIK